MFALNLLSYVPEAAQHVATDSKSGWGYAGFLIGVAVIALTCFVFALGSSLTVKLPEKK